MSSTNAYDIGITAGVSMGGVYAELDKLEARLKKIGSVKVGMSTSAAQNPLSGGIAKGMQAATSSLNATNTAAKQTKTSLKKLSDEATSLEKLRKKINSSNKELEEFGRQAAQTLKRFTAFVLVVNVFNSLQQAIQQSTKDAIDFEKEMYKISQVTGLSYKSLGELDAEITRLSTTLGVSAGKITNVALTLAQAGLSARDTKVALDVLAKTELSATFEDIGSTTEATIAIMAQFGSSAEDLKQQLSSINTVAAKFAVESKDIITGIKGGSSVFLSAGGSLNEYIATLTSIRATTRESAESIATGLRTIVTRLQRTRTRNFLTDLGIDLKNSQGDFVNVYEAIGRISEAVKDLDTRDPRFGQILEELGGYRQINKVIPLLKEFELSQKALNVANRAGASIDRDAEIAKASLANQIARVKQEFDALIRSYMSDTVIRKMVTGVLDLASAFIRLADSIKSITPALAFLGVNSLLKTVGPIAKGFTGKGILKSARGGPVPGVGSGDTVPAMLEPGEFVIRKRAVQAFGAANLHQINGYATGGMVGGDMSDMGPPQKFAKGGFINTLLRKNKIFNRRKARDYAARRAEYDALPGPDNINDLKLVGNVLTTLGFYNLFGAGPRASALVAQRTPSPFATGPVNQQFKNAIQDDNTLASLIKAQKMEKRSTSYVKSSGAFQDGTDILTPEKRLEVMARNERISKSLILPGAPSGPLIIPPLKELILPSSYVSEPTRTESKAPVRDKHIEKILRKYHKRKPDSERFSLFNSRKNPAPVREDFKGELFSGNRPEIDISRGRKKYLPTIKPVPQASSKAFDVGLQKRIEEAQARGARAEYGEDLLPPKTILGKIKRFFQGTPWLTPEIVQEELLALQKKTGLNLTKILGGPVKVRRELESLDSGLSVGALYNSNRRDITLSAYQIRDRQTLRDFLYHEVGHGIDHTIGLAKGRQGAGPRGFESADKKGLFADIIKSRLKNHNKSYVGYGGRQDVKGYLRSPEEQIAELVADVGRNAIGPAAITTPDHVNKFADIVNKFGLRKYARGGIVNKTMPKYAAIPASSSYGSHGNWAANQVSLSAFGAEAGQDAVLPIGKFPKGKLKLKKQFTGQILPKQPVKAPSQIHDDQYGTSIEYLLKRNSFDFLNANVPIKTPGYSENDTKILRYYSHQGDKEMNSLLRGQFDPNESKRPIDVVRGRAKYLKKLFKKHKLAAPTTLYRGISSKEGLEAIENQIGTKIDDPSAIGKVFSDRGFSSTSTSRNMGFNFGEKFFLVIKAPKGTPAIDMSSPVTSHHFKEKEILLPAQSRFRITKNSPNSNAIEVERFAKGGGVHGVGDADTIPALLTPGEFVVNKKSAKQFGYGNLHKINRLAQGTPASADAPLGNIASGGLKNVLGKAGGAVGSIVLFTAMGKLMEGFESLGETVTQTINAVAISGGILGAAFLGVGKNVSTATDNMAKLATLSADYTKKIEDLEKSTSSLADEIDTFTTTTGVDANGNVQKHIPPEYAAKLPKLKEDRARRDELKQLRDSADKERAGQEAGLPAAKKFNKLLKTVAIVSAAAAGIGSLASSFAKSNAKNGNQSILGISNETVSGVGGALTGAVNYGAGGALIGGQFGLQGAIIGGAAGAVYGAATGFVGGQEEIRSAKTQKDFQESIKGLDTIFKDISEGKTSLGRQKPNINRTLDEFNSKFYGATDEDLKSFKAQLQASVAGLESIYEESIKTAAQMGKTENDFEAFRKENESVIKTLSRFGDRTLPELESEFKKGVAREKERSKGVKADVANDKRLESLLAISSSIGDAERSIIQLSSSMELLDGMIQGVYGSARGSFDFSALDNVGGSNLNDVRQQATQAAGFLGSAGNGLANDIVHAAELSAKIPSLLEELVSGPQLAPGGDYRDKVRDKLQGKGGKATFASDLLASAIAKEFAADGDQTQLIKAFKEDPIGLIKRIQASLDPFIASLRDEGPRIVEQFNAYADGLARARGHLLSSIDGLVKVIDINQYQGEFNAAASGQTLSFAQNREFDADRFNAIGALGGTSNQIGADLAFQNSQIEFLQKQLSGSSDEGEVKYYTDAINAATLEAERNTRALEHNADVTSRLESVNKELGRLRQERQNKANLAADFVFGGPEEKRRIIKGLMSVRQIEANKLSGKTNQLDGLSQENRELAREMYTRYSGDKVFNGKTGQERLNEISQIPGVNQDFNTPNAEEAQVQAIGNAILEEGRVARSELNNILTSNTDKYMKNLNTQFETFFTRLEKSTLDKQEKLKKDAEDSKAIKAAGEADAKAKLIAAGKNTGLDFTKDRTVSSVQAALTKVSEIKDLRASEARLKAARDKVLKDPNNLGFIEGSLGDESARQINKAKGEYGFAAAGRGFYNLFSENKDTAEQAKARELYDAEIAKTSQKLTEATKSIFTQLGITADVLIKNADMLKAAVDQLEPTATINKLEMKAAGGPIWSKRGSDTVPAMTTDGKPYMLTPGEFVMNRRAVGKYGVSTLERMNSAELAGGGIVSEFRNGKKPGFTPFGQKSKDSEYLNGKTPTGPKTNSKSEYLNGKNPAFAPFGNRGAYSEFLNGKTPTGPKTNSKSEYLNGKSPSFTPYGYLGPNSEFRNGKNPRIVPFGYKEPKFGEGVRLRRGIKARLISNGVLDNFYGKRPDSETVPGQYDMGAVNFYGKKPESAAIPGQIVPTEQQIRLRKLQEYNRSNTLYNRTDGVKRPKNLLERIAEQHARSVKMIEASQIRRGVRPDSMAAEAPFVDYSKVDYAYKNKPVHPENTGKFGNYDPNRTKAPSGKRVSRGYGGAKAIDYSKTYRDLYNSNRKKKYNITASKMLARLEARQVVDSKYYGTEYKSPETRNELDKGRASFQHNSPRAIQARMFNAQKKAGIIANRDQRYNKLNSEYAKNSPGVGPTSQVAEAPKAAVNPVAPAKPDAKSSPANGLAVQMINPDLMKEFNLAINKLAGSKLTLEISGSVDVRIIEGNLGDSITQKFKEAIKEYVDDKIVNSLNQFASANSLAATPINKTKTTAKGK